MQDLNDLYYFTQVVEYGGFAAAARALGVPKSKLSRRVTALEQRLGVRLLQRSTRRISVTDIGREYLRHCAVMLAEADAAQEVVDRSRSYPTGTLKIGCPTGLLHARVAVILNRFMVEYPHTRIHLEASSRRVDVIGEGFDVVLRVRFPPLEDSDLVVHTLGYGEQRLVASPTLLEQFGPVVDPADLTPLPSVDFGPPNREHIWDMEGPGGGHLRIAHQPRLVTDDLAMLRVATLGGVGVAQLPSLVVDDDIAAGSLRTLLPGWHSKIGIIQAAFPSRRGLIPAVRHLLDLLSAEFAREPALATPPHWSGQEAYRLEIDGTGKGKRRVRAN